MKKKLSLKKVVLSNLNGLTENEAKGIAGGDYYTCAWDFLCNSYQNCQATNNIYCDDGATWACHSGHCVN